MACWVLLSQASRSQKQSLSQTPSCRSVFCPPCKWVIEIRTFLQSKSFHLGRSFLLEKSTRHLFPHSGWWNATWSDHKDVNKQTSLSHSLVCVTPLSISILHLPNIQFTYTIQEFRSLCLKTLTLNKITVGELICFYNSC